MLKITAKPGQGFKKLLADAQAESKRANQATIRALGRFGAIVRQDARKLIGAPTAPRKFRKVWLTDEQRYALVTARVSAPRPPGKPPRARRKGDNYATIRNIRYLPDYRKNIVQIGFWGINVKYGSAEGAELHEFGGVFKTRIILVPGDVTQESLEVRKDGKRTVATRKYSKLNIIESRKKGRPVTFRMPKRPTIAPAFNKHKNNMTQIWIDYYNARRR